SVPERILNHPMTVRAADLIPVALLGALIAVQVFADGQHLVIDARLLGLGVAAILLILRMPFLGVVFGAALAAALVRLI
ncbi:MAG: AzlD domain-containing protein, partial [Aeromicrobium sp.]